MKLNSEEKIIGELHYFTSASLICDDVFQFFLCFIYINAYANQISYLSYT